MGIRSFKNNHRSVFLALLMALLLLLTLIMVSDVSYGEGEGFEITEAISNTLWYGGDLVMIQWQSETSQTYWVKE